MISHRRSGTFKTSLAILELFPVLAWNSCRSLSLRGHALQRKEKCNTLQTKTTTKIPQCLDPSNALNVKTVAVFVPYLRLRYFNHYFSFLWTHFHFIFFAYFTLPQTMDRKQDSTRGLSRILKLMNLIQIHI